MIALLPWLKSPNLWAIVAIVGLCVGIYTAGQHFEKNKLAANMAAINEPILEQRGRDETELAAEALAAEMRDQVFASAPRQQFILDEETAKLLGNVK